MEERLTKKERKEQRKLEELRKMEEKSSSSGNMKWIVIGLASILFLGFFIFAVVSAKNKAQTPVTLSSSGQVTGNPEGKVTVTEFGDFQCPACKAFEPSMDRVRSEYKDDVRIVFKHFPLKAVHPNAFPSAMAAEAAASQGKFWEYHDLLYDNQEEWAALSNPTDKFVSYAKSLSLDVDKFKKDLANNTLKAKINEQEDEGIAVGVSGTPTVFVDGLSLGVPRNYDVLKKEIDRRLNSSR